MSGSLDVILEPRLGARRSEKRQRKFIGSDVPVWIDVRSVLTGDLVPGATGAAALYRFYAIGDDDDAPDQPLPVSEPAPGTLRVNVPCDLPGSYDVEIQIDGPSRVAAHITFDVTTAGGITFNSSGAIPYGDIQSVAVAAALSATRPEARRVSIEFGAAAGAQAAGPVALAAIAGDVQAVETARQQVVTNAGKAAQSESAASTAAGRAEGAAAVATSIATRIANLRLPPALIVHRGGAHLGPENTLAAFRNAAALGILDWEMDLQPTSDDVIVVMHDNSTVRTTGQDYEVISTPYATLRSLDAGSWFSPRFAGEPIPTFEEVLQLAKECGARIYAEYKRSRGNADYARIVALVKAYDMEDQVELSSFFLAPLQYTRTLSSRITLGLLTNKNFNDVPALAAIRPASIVTDQALILAQPEQVTIIRAAGLGLSAWTVNTLDQRDALARIGVDRVLSDYDLRAA